MQAIRKPKPRTANSVDTSASDEDLGQLRHLLTLWARYMALGTKGDGPKLHSPGIWKGILRGRLDQPDEDYKKEYSEEEYRRVNSSVNELPFDTAVAMKAEYGVAIMYPGCDKPFYAKGGKIRARANSIDVPESTYKDRIAWGEKVLVISLRELWE